MRSSCREDILDQLDALHEVVSDLLELSFDALTTPELLGLLERLEHETRRLPVTPTGEVPDGWPDQFDGLVERPTTYGREGHRLHAHPGGLQRSKHHLAEHLRADGVFTRLS